MRSLNAHLTEAGGHGHLPFHPGCPVCRAERLAGRLEREPVLSPRAQASLLAAVLALSGAAPPGGTVASAAAAVDEGSAAPGEGKAPGEAEPGFDPGNEVPLPNEVPEAPPIAGGDDESAGGPVENEPQDQFGLKRGPGAVPAPQPANPPLGSIGQPAPPSPPPQAPTTPTAQPPAPAGETRERGAERKQEKRPGRGQAKKGRAAPRVGPPRRDSVPIGSAAPLRSTGGGSSAVPSAAVGPVAASASQAANGRVHIVRRGESLWSIADDQLGAGASLARIAQQVNRLWELNKQRIATGDPDMLMVGTKLELPPAPRG